MDITLAGDERVTIPTAELKGYLSDCIRCLKTASGW